MADGPVTTPLDNAAIADRLEAFAALLDLSARRLHAPGIPAGGRHGARDAGRVDELVRAGRVRELRGIGAGIAARLEELVETGRIAELDELERELRPELIGLGRLLGLGPKRMLEIGEALDVRTAEEFRAAADAGGLRGCGASGRPPSGRCSNGCAAARRPDRRAADAVRGARARRRDRGALGGETAGDARRWVDTPRGLAAVVAAPIPRRCSTRSRACRRSLRWWSGRSGARSE